MSLINMTITEIFSILAFCSSFSILIVNILQFFSNNKDIFIEEVKNRYNNVIVHNNFYYHARKNACWIIQASNEPLTDYGIDDVDEQKAIELICASGTACIGDFCMGRGLVGFYANKVGRQFVGTELNKNRLAVLLHRIGANRL